MDYDQLLENAVYYGTLRALRAHRREVAQERQKKPQCLAIASKSRKQCTLSADAEDSDYCYLHRHYGERANS